LKSCQQSSHLKSFLSVRLGSCGHLFNVKRLIFLGPESGGDNLAANFSRELADYIIYVIDVAGGDKIPRKGGPGITQADLLVINKTDLAAAVGANLEVMEREAKQMRQNTGPVLMTQVKNGVGVPEIINFIVTTWKERTGAK